MSEAICSTSLMNQFVAPNALPVDPGFYRSKLFSSSATPNALLAAANPLFSLLERLGSSQTMPAIDVIWDNLEHELKAFRSRLISLKCADELRFIAQYLISATVDELLGKNYIRVNGTPAEFQAFTPPSHDNVGPERRFFEIVEQIQTRPNQYLDLIELAYYCLISGFEGEQHVNTVGRQNLDNLIESLHELIQKNRVAKPVRLFTVPHPEATQATLNHKPWLKLTGIALGVLISAYATSQALLEHKAKTILNNQFQPVTVRS